MRIWIWVGTLSPCFRTLRCRLQKQVSVSDISQPVWPVHVSFSQHCKKSYYFTGQMLWISLHIITFCLCCQNNPWVKLYLYLSRCDTTVLSSRQPWIPWSWGRHRVWLMSPLFLSTSKGLPGDDDHLQTVTGEQVKPMCWQLSTLTCPERANDNSISITVCVSW